METWKIKMIQDTVANLKSYATSIYKSLWQDALDAAFFHIIKHFDFTVSEDDEEDLSEKLYRYSTKVVGTILLGKYNHEIEHEISLINGIDQRSMNEESKMNPLSILIEGEELDQSQNLSDCIKYLTPYFIKDFKFFKTKRSDQRKLKYTGLFEKYSSDIIMQSMKYLVDNYSNIMEDMYSKISKSRYRMFSEDRYKKNLDSAVCYKGYVNDTLIYSTTSRVKGNKSFYFFNIKDTISDMIKEYYSDSNSVNSGKYTIEDTVAYISLSGVIVFTESELRTLLEYELIGAILAKISHLKVVVYEKGKSMILSSPKDNECGLICNIFSTNYHTYFKRLVSKRLEEAKIC